MTAPTESIELPPQSRITSRAVGSELTISIPRASRANFPVGWTAATAFLAITFTAQGVLTHSVEWSAGGLAIFILFVALLLVGFAKSLSRPSPVVLKIAPESLTVTTGAGKDQIVKTWPKSSISSLRCELSRLDIYLNNVPRPICLIRGHEELDLAWIADQINIRWHRRKESMPLPISHVAGAPGS
jgi:hypothetical protein